MPEGFERVSTDNCLTKSHSRPHYRIYRRLRRFIYPSHNLPSNFMLKFNFCTSDPVDFYEIHPNFCSSYAGLRIRKDTSLSSQILFVLPIPTRSSIDFQVMGVEESVKTRWVFKNPNSKKQPNSMLFTFPCINICLFLTFGKPTRWLKISPKFLENLPTTCKIDPKRHGYIIMISKIFIFRN